MRHDEIWTMRDGTKIAVGDMSEDHVRNALRMVLRQKRRRARQTVEYPMTVGEAQDQLNAEAMMQLANPNAYFPLLGCHGSPALAARYRK